MNNKKYLIVKKYDDKKDIIAANFIGEIGCPIGMRVDKQKAFERLEELKEVYKNDILEIWIENQNVNKTGGAYKVDA